MPKQRITREMVIDTAFELARSGGMEQVLVKNIAGKLGCSVQPIYSYLDNMGNLRKEVEIRAGQFIREAVSAALVPDDIFRSTGKAWLAIARREPHLFRLFVFQERQDIASFADLYQAESGPGMAGTIAGELGISLEQARELHLNMLIYTIGMGTIFSVANPGIPAQEIFARQEKAYQAFLQYAEQGTDAGCKQKEMQKEP